MTPSQYEVTNTEKKDTQKRKEMKKTESRQLNEKTKQFKFNNILLQIQQQ